MIGRDFKFHNGKKGAALAIRLEVGRKQDRIKKVLKDGTVIIEISASAADPEKELIQFLAGELKMSIKNFDIVEGKDGVDFLLSILDVSPEIVQNQIMEKIS